MNNDFSMICVIWLSGPENESIWWQIIICKKKKRYTSSYFLIGSKDQS